MLSGMEPIKLFLETRLHPNIHTEVGLGVKFNVYHIKYALHSTAYYLSYPPFIHLGLAAQNNPYIAHNYSIETRVPPWKWGMSNSRCSWEYSLRIPSQRGLCPQYFLSAHKIWSMTLRYALSPYVVFVVYLHSRNVNVFTRVVVGREIPLESKHDVFSINFHSCPKLMMT